MRRLAGAQPGRTIVEMEREAVEEGRALLKAEAGEGVPRTLLYPYLGATIANNPPWDWTTRPIAKTRLGTWDQLEARDWMEAQP